MDVIFKCPNCEQELSVDATAAGAEIQCPSCAHNLVVPPPEPAKEHAVNPIATSAAAKEEKHFKVPQHEVHSESLITKPLAPLEVSAKEGIKMRVKSIRHSDCVEVGKDRFDEVVTEFLTKIGEHNIISVNTFAYTHMDLATRAWVTDYGVLVVYRG
jgi:DNA-directed RNA polymerase subunit RPC12/RpoP